MTKMQVEQKHFLALLYRPGDYSLIDISKLDIANNSNPSSLQEIDAFTMNYTKEEIIASIMRANIVSSFEGDLVIQDNQKHNPLPVIDKTFYNGFQIDIYLENELSDKNGMNTIINKFKAIALDNDMSQEFAASLKNGNILATQNILFSLPYLSLRRFIIYLVELKNKEKMEKEQELIRDKAA